MKQLKQYTQLILVSLFSAAIASTFTFMAIRTNNNSSSLSNNSIVSTVQYSNKQNSSYALASEKARPTVVEITSTVTTTSSFFYTQQEGISKGSGVVLTSDGYIVTNNHVVEGAKKVVVKLQDESEYEAQIVGLDAKADLALLKIEAYGLDFATIADDSNIQVGDEVLAIGNPLGEGITVSNGIISSLSKELVIDSVYMNVIQTNAAINSGNSGGGLFNLNGDLVGIVNAKSSTSSSGVTVEGMGYAIPGNTVSTIISELKQYGYVKSRATLGVACFSDEYTAYYIRNAQGVVVSEVIQGSASEKAGIQAYDCIVSIDDVEITSMVDLSKHLYTKKVGDVVTLKIIRDGKEFTVNVTLQEASNS